MSRTTFTSQIDSELGLLVSYLADKLGQTRMETLETLIYDGLRSYLEENHPEQVTANLDELYGRIHSYWEMQSALGEERRTSQR